MNRNERDFFTTTPRLGFSLWTAADLPLAKALWGDRRVTRYISGPEGFGVQEIEERLQLEISHQRQMGYQYWPLTLLETGGFAGCCGFRPCGGRGDILEFGFHLLPEHWGKGLAQEAGKAALAYAREALGYQTIMAGHHPDNGSSRKALERLGFVRDGEHLYPPTGRIHPQYRYQK